MVHKILQWPSNKIPSEHSEFGFFVSLKSFHLATSVPNIGLANNEAEDEDVCDLSMPP